MEELPVCSRPADEGSLMSKEYNFEDFEDDYDTNPWEDVQKKWAADGVIIITTRKGKKGEKVKVDFFAYIPIFIAWESDIFGKTQKSVAWKIPKPQSTKKEAAP